MTLRSMVVVAGIVVAIARLMAAADPDAAAAYERVIAARADKVVASLHVASEGARDRVRGVLLDFFRSLNSWHDAHAARRRELRSAKDAAAREECARLDHELAELRAGFVAGLAADLSPPEIDRVKDALTYNVLHVTERAYHEMIETLTAEQKATIHDWLVEARDLAISEGSSEAKHGVFGKYKGRINNYLSQQGYDLKEEERGWQARRKAAAEAPSTTKEPK
jgi:hypothetical protein